MLTKNQISFFSSLKHKKYRLEHRKTLVEGLKPVRELIKADFPIDYILYLEGGGFNLEVPDIHEEKLIPVNSKTLQRISTQKSPEGIIAVIPVPERTEAVKGIDTIYLYRLNDPGNLGTIIRTATYFDIRQIVLSPDSVEAWSPKAIRGSMGSIFHTHIVSDLEIDALIEEGEYRAIIATTSHGRGISGDSELRSPWLLIMGSESHGLPGEIFKKSTHQFSIPRPGYGESLNVSVSVGIILHYLTRS